MASLWCTCQRFVGWNTKTNEPVLQRCQRRFLGDPSWTHGSFCSTLCQEEDYFRRQLPDAAWEMQPVAENQGGVYQSSRGNRQLDADEVKSPTFEG